MADLYKIKYRCKGQLFWRTIKDVRGDEIVFGTLDQLGNKINPLFRSFVTDDDSIYYIPLDAEVVFPSNRQDIVTKKMSREIGQPVQR